MATRIEIRAAIREDCEADALAEQFEDGPDEEEAIAECENCGEKIYAHSDALGLVHRDGGEYRTMYLCRDCARQMRVTDILTLLDVMYYEPVVGHDADRVVEKTSRFCREMNQARRSEFRRMISTAAEMAKGVRA